MRSLNFYSSSLNLRSERVSQEVEDTERFVQDVLEDHGFETVNLDNSIYDAPSEVSDYLTDQYEEHTGMSESGRVNPEGTGMPDILAWKKKNSGFLKEVVFVEVKTDSDSLHKPQNKWMQTYGFFDTAIAWIEENAENEFGENPHKL